MTNRTVSSRASRIAALLVLATLLLGTLPVHAASSVQIEARGLVAGRYEAGGWAAIAVTLVNDGEPTEGHVSAETRSGVMRRFVEMPAGARKVVMLYVQPEAFQRRITVRYEEPNGTVESVVELRVFEQSNAQFAVIGDGGGTLRPQLLGSDELGAPEPITLALSDLPERPEPLGGLSAIVWAGDSAALSEAQRRSLERWVADGGQLVLVGGADWQARTAAFEDLLPLEGLTAVDGVSHAALAAWSGADAPAVQEATVSSGTLRNDARALITAEDGAILASMRSIGAGRVILLGSDLATDAYRGWEGSPRLWARLLPTGALLDQFFGGGFPVREEAENSISQALGNIPSLEVPPAELLLVVILGYILLIGPISYLVLRRIDRRELAWITAPLLVVLFTACSYGIGSTLKGGEVVINQISLVRSSAGGGTAAVESYAGIFSPDRSTYDLSVETDALMGQLRPSGMPGGGQVGGSVVVDQGDPTRLRGLAIGVFGFSGVRADGVIEHESTLSVTWARDEDDKLVGTVTNTGDEPVSDVAYISSGGGEMIGDLEPGESGEFTLSGRNFNGSSASDQVYGFGGFEPSGERERRILVRRGVIDSLVGYGAFMPGIEMGPSGRGPYIVGWRESDGPLPVAVDGLTALRHAQTVEVLGAPPPIGIGAVTIEPAQMAVAILETEGDTSSGGPGMVVVGNGSATFSVALPLEAAGMSVTELTVIAGPDPGMVLDPGGGFDGGFWPPGYTIEIRHPRTGEWTMLGDLSRQSRFGIEEPAEGISDTGRIEVRVSGAEIDQNFGESSVFVSAQVKGVIGE